MPGLQLLPFLSKTGGKITPSTHPPRLRTFYQLTYSTPEKNHPVHDMFYAKVLEYWSNQKNSL